MFKTCDHIDFKYKQEIYKGTTLQWYVIIYIQSKVHMIMIINHCVKSKKICTGMVCDCIDLRYTKFEYKCRILIIISVLYSEHYHISKP